MLQDAAIAYRRAVEVTQNRFAGKISSGIDVERAKNQLDAAEASLTDILAKRALVEHAIASAGGQATPPS